MASMRLGAIALAALLSLVPVQDRGVLALSIFDEATGRPTPARVEVLDSDGKGQIAEDAIPIGGD